MTQDSAAPAAVPQHAPPGAASLWRHGPFRLLWAGQTASEVGSEVSTLVLPLLAVSALHATTFEIAVLGTLGRLPFLLFALPAGVVVDRVRRRRLMLWCDATRLLLTASVPAAAWWWHVTLGQLYVVAAGVGVLTVFFDVAYQSLLPSLVAPDRLMDANGKLGTTQSFAQFAGPPLGGTLAGLVGAARAVAADAASYAVSTLTLLLIRTPEARPQRAEGTERVGFRAAMSQGLRFVTDHPILRKIVACTATANFFSGAVGALEVVYLVRTLHASPAVVGLVLGLAAIGGVAGGLCAGRLTRWIGSARIIWVSLAASAPLSALMPLSRPGWSVWLYAVGLSALSASGVVYNTAQLSYRQSICPPGLLGRLNASVRWIAWGALPLGSLAGGAVASGLGVREALWICVPGTCAAPLWVVFSPLRRMRDVPAAGVAVAPAG